MKKIIVMGLSLTILAAIWGGGIAHAAQGASSQNTISSVDPIKKRQTSYSARKAAAKHLKLAHLKQRKKHGGATKGKKGQNAAGASIANNQTPASQGGVK